jgi:hypothetical protein
LGSAFPRLRVTPRLEPERREVRATGWAVLLLFFLRLVFAKEIFDSKMLLSSAHVENSDIPTLNSIVNPTWPHPNLPIARVRKFGYRPAQQSEAVQMIRSFSNPTDDCFCGIQCIERDVLESWVTAPLAGRIHVSRHDPVRLGPPASLRG